ncbi:hypothetical protein BH23PAT1_BH23PAT1_5520 [soil metagenome]
MTEKELLRSLSTLRGFWAEEWLQMHEQPLGRPKIPLSWYRSLGWGSREDETYVLHRLVMSAHRNKDAFSNRLHDAVTNISLRNV